MKTLSILLFAASVAASADASGAITEGRTANDRAYVAGGIGLEESERMKQMADKYSLQLIVSSRSGAYLADTRVTITGANSQKVLDLPLDAPWVLVDLAPGSYKVSVTHAGMAQERNVTLAPGKREQIVVQFNVAADTAKSPPAAVK
ncbi:MAG TPA: carboxypeptidase-like regulatory domain-containing protein [Burkholderiaceae bacterium]|nr:carboxypeptidase-like regulatory domain-containing protein [Burkholderiaceae bacterium]